MAHYLDDDRPWPDSGQGEDAEPDLGVGPTEPTVEELEAELPPAFCGLGLGLVTRARARQAAYQRGMDDAIDGRGWCPEQFALAVHQGRYCQGYAAGRAQLATYATPRPVNPARDHD